MADNTGPEYSERIAKAARAVLKKEVRHLQLIPVAAVKLLKLTNDENTKVKDLSRVIETEPALAAKVLRIVNSAAFCLPKKITSIKHAVNMLGFSAVRQTALDQLFYNRLIRHQAKQLFDQLFFWQHCLFVATLSREIAVTLKHPDPDMVYTGGLLHDIGKVVLETYGRVTYSDFLSSLDKSDISLRENERAFFGLTHTEMGHVFGVTWNLPPVITAMISFHHEPSNASSAYSQYVTEIAIVSFANYIAWVQGVGSVMGFSGPRLPEEVLKIIDVSKLNLEYLLERVDREMAKTREFYGIQFPSITKMRATLVQNAIELSQNGYSNSKRKAIYSNSRDHRSNIYSLTIPHRSLNPEEFIPWTLEAIQTDFGLDRAVMLEIDPKRRSLIAGHSWPRSIRTNELGPFEIPINSVSGNLLECLRNRKPMLIKGGNSSDQAILQKLQVAEFIVVPILHHNRMVGVIYADNVLTHQPLDETLLTDMMPIVNELGIALLNAKQYDMARKQSQIDPLSQLFNKRVINEFLTRLFKSPPDVLVQTAVGFIDIDRFKQFNDECGHQAGDDVLKIVADILRNLTRPGDLIGRYGGEEFLFVLRNTDKAGALVYAERIRLEIERRGNILSERFRGHALTVSVGLVMYDARFKSYPDVIEAADKAMYRAKNEGRNRVVMLADAN
ncbi:MAG: HDOD domain-containing protein [Gammaproteobacteria bacterium]